MRATGGNALGSVAADFETRNEAEEWMLGRTSLATAGSGILEPGGGQNVA